MKTIFNKIIAFTTLITISVSCVNENFIDPNQVACVEPLLLKNKEVTDIYAVAINPVAIAPSTIPNTPEYTADDVIEAYVISNDKGGNFFKNMYFQPTDGSRGFIMSVNDDNVYNEGFEPGRKVYLKMKGLHYGNPSDFTRGLVFGAKPTDIFDVDRIPTLAYKKYLIPSCQIVDEETIVHKVTLAQALSDTYLNTLVEIDGVQFKSNCSTYSEPDFDTSLKITTGTTSTTIDVRTSKFAKFAGEQVPSGNGKIRGVLGKYNSGYQLILRTEKDVQFTNPRIETPTPALVGNNLQYTGSLNETFESYAATTTGANLPKYINDVVIGYKYWDVVSFSSNKYLQATAFNNGCTKAYFIVPVDFTAANGFSFKSKDGYNDGVPLKVYYSTTYVPGGAINATDLVDITSKFAIADGRPTTATSYASNFTNSGTYAIPATLTGNGYFIFEYDGTTGKTTTIQLDDIIIN